MSNVWVCGAKGQLGQSLLKIVGCSTHKYIFTDVEEVDICNCEAVETFVKEHKIDVIINCAAYTAVDAAETDVVKADEVNHLAVGYLSGVAVKHDAFLIHISTDYVFDGKGEVPYKEDDKITPQSVYGKTKLEGEEAVIKSGCGYIILRTAWLYSEYGKNFVKTMMALTAEKASISVVNDQIGSPTYAGDLARVIYDIVEKDTYRENQGVYHYVGDGSCSWYELACQVAHMAGNDKCVIKPCTTSEYPTAAIRPAYSVLDTTKIKNVFGVQAPHWKDALCRCMTELKRIK